MKAAHQSPTERRPSLRNLLALHTETPALSNVEDLYWFAMALTGDSEFAAKLVADAGNSTATSRGVLH
jgi:hypothetical protein